MYKLYVNEVDPYCRKSSTIEFHVRMYRPCDYSYRLANDMQSWTERFKRLIDKETKCIRQDEDRRMRTGVDRTGDDYEPYVYFHHTYDKLQSREDAIKDVRQAVKRAETRLKEMSRRVPTLRNIVLSRMIDPVFTIKMFHDSDSKGVSQSDISLLRKIYRFS